MIMRSSMRRDLLGSAALLATLSATAALAQDFPSRPITIVVPFGAGDGPVSWPTIAMSSCL
ncbi:MAG: hypothetical protein J0M00_04935 [Burkholderiales bacterium]|nr:hypothetical protein [Burkholderiales bacterium]